MAKVPKAIYVNPLVWFALQRTRTTIFLLVAVLITGFYAFLVSPKEGDPDAEIPFVFINIPHPGISPNDSTRLIVKPLEKELANLDGLRTMRAIGGEGYASIVLEFLNDTNIDFALIDVREGINRARAKLPDTIEEPNLESYNTALEPVIRVIVSGEVPYRLLKKLTQQLDNRLEALPQVHSTKVTGYREEVIEILVDPGLLEAHGVSPSSLSTAFTKNNALLPLGSIENRESRFSVKIPSGFRSAKDLEKLPIRNGDQNSLTLGDIAKIHQIFSPTDQTTKLNGQLAISIAVTKRLGENILDTIEAIKAAVAVETKHWSQNIYVTYTNDRSIEIHNSINDLMGNIAVAILLVVIVVTFALGVRSATLVATIIPISFFFAFVVLYSSGHTINIMVLFGLVVSIGLLVDNGILITEFAERQRELGSKNIEAYASAGSELFWPLVSSTATTLLAFAPLLFWPGVLGEFMYFLPLTMCLVLIGSLLTAMLFIPALGKTLFVDSPTPENIQTGKHSSSGSGLYRFTATKYYAALLNQMLRYPLSTIAVSIAACVIALGLSAPHSNGLILLSEAEPTRAFATVRARGNHSISEMEELTSLIEEILLQEKGVSTSYSIVGPDQSADPFLQVPADKISQIYIEFENWRFRRSIDSILQSLRSQFSEIPGLIVEINPFERGIGDGKDFQLVLTSNHPKGLLEHTKMVRQYLKRNVAGLTDIDDTSETFGLEWEILIDFELANQMGASALEIAEVIQIIAEGAKIGKLQPLDLDEEIDILLRLPAEDRYIDQIANTKVSTANGLIPIRNFVEFRPANRTANLERIDKKWATMIRGNVLPDVLTTEKVAEIREWLEAYQKSIQSQEPRTFSFFFEGQDRLQEESTGFLGYAFFCSILLIATVLLTQFNSWYFLLVTLSAVVTSIIGVFLGTTVTQQPFSVVLTGTGIVALAGIVVNNNIVFVSTYKSKLHTYTDEVTALLETANERFRPILLTTGTTVVGLAPMAMQIGFSFDHWNFTHQSPTSFLWKPMASAVVFGLLVSMFFSLFLTPVSLLAPSALRNSFLRITKLKRN